MEQEQVRKERRHWKTEDKVKALRKHLIEKETVTKICDEMGLAPSQYHRWQEQLFLNASLAMEGKRPERTEDHKKVEKLEQKIRQKDEVLAELLAEHIALKKELGEL